MLLILPAKLICCFCQCCQTKITAQKNDQIEQGDRSAPAVLEHVPAQKDHSLTKTPHEFTQEITVFQVIYDRKK